MTKDDVYIILQSTYQLVYDGEWWNVTGFNEEECYLEHCEDGEEMNISLDELANSNVDYYELKMIDIGHLKDIPVYKKQKADKFDNHVVKTKG